MQDKTKIIEKIVTDPQSLNDAEILMISADKELQEIYECTAMIAGATCDVPAFDADRSLSELHAAMQRHAVNAPVIKRFSSPIRRAAAVAAVCISLTAIAVLAAIYFAPSRSDAPAEQTVEVTNIDEAVDTPKADDKPGKLYYDDAPLSEILKDLSVRYQCEVRYVNEASRDSRFHITIAEDATLEDVIEMLNAFDEVKITLTDNTIVVE